MTSPAPARSVREHLLEIGALAISAQLALWSIDVLVNLGLAKRLVRPHELIGTPTDFAGLFLVDLQVALLATAVACLLATLLARVLGSGDSRWERVAIVTALFAVLTVTVGSSLVWGILSGVIAWVVVRLVPRGPLSRTWPGRTALIVWLLLVAAFGVHGADYAATRTWGPAAANGVAAVLALLGFVVTVRFKTRARAWMFGLVPLWAALALGTKLCVGSAFYYGNETAAGGSGNGSGPNIVLIVLDTVRADHLKGFGHHRDTMPALERWGSNALMVTRAVSPAGWTMPAHASLFSGRSVSEHGIHHGAGTERRSPFRTPALEGIVWLPDVLAALGYDCLAVSANLLAIPDEVTGFRKILNPDHSDWDRTVAAFVDRRSPLTARLSERLRWRLPYVDAARIIDITMRAVPETNGPVFLFVNLMDAHSPYHPPAESMETFGNSNEHLFSRYSSHTDLRRQWDALPPGKEQYLESLYDGELRWLDGNLARVLSWIDERFGEDSIVIVTSDHGEELGEEGRVGHEYGLGQSLVHVPLYVRSPALPAGRTDSVFSLRGLFHFIAASARGEEPSLTGLDGQAALSERYPCGACTREFGPDYARPWVSLIEGSVKAVGPSTYGLELYHLSESRFDRKTKYKDPTAAQVLGERIDLYWETHRDRREGKGASSPSKDERDRLKSLGYVN